MNKLKSKLLVLLSAMVMMFCSIIGVNALQPQKTVNASTATPTLTVESNNVSYAESIYILYAVSHDGFDRNEHPIKMLFWEEVQEEYVIGTEKYAKTDNGAATVKSKPCLVFYSKGLAAKRMTEDIYARAYVEIDGVAYYSDTLKFSVLEYVHTQREKGGLTPNQQALFDNMLNYGGAAQNNFGHNTDRLANDTYYGIKVHGGKCPDGFQQGRYKKGDKFFIKAEEPETGKKFWYWKDEHGIIVSYDKNFEIEIGESNKEYEAVYKDVSNVATQLALSAEIPSDGTLQDVEFPTAVSLDVNDETVALDVTWDTSEFIEKQIGTQTFYAELTDRTAYEKYGIEYGSIVLKLTTLPYTYALNQTSGEYIVTGYFGADEELTLPTAYRNTAVSTIATNAFNGVITLKNVTIPTVYTKIENGAFNLCDNMESITIPFVGETATSNNSYFGWIFGATSYSSQNIVLPLALKTVTISEGATKIPNEAFYQCKFIENFNIPSTIIQIYSNAFYGCKRFTEFTIPSRLTTIDSSAFYNSGLTRVNAFSLEQLFSLNNSPFNNGDTGASLYIENVLITEITIPEKIATLYNVLSYCSSIQKATIPTGVTTIGKNAFAYCNNLTEVAISNTVTTLGDNAFYHCQNLTTIAIPNSVTSIGNSAFVFCENLPNLTIPQSVNHIGSRAFSSCNSFTEIVLPDSVTAVSVGLFESCINLTKVTLGKNVTTIDSDAFRSCRILPEIVIPDSVTSIGKQAFAGCFDLTKINLPSGITTIAEKAFNSCSKLKEITIPENVSEIQSAAFLYCYNLSRVEILSTRLVQINSSAFSKCHSLTSIVIPDTVLSIGSNAFYNCNALTIYCEAESQPENYNSSWNPINCPVVWDCNNNDIATDGNIYTIIDGVRYAIKDEVATVVKQARNITVANIPSDIVYHKTTYPVTSIMEGAFYHFVDYVDPYEYTYLTTLIIGDNVTSIEQSTFKNCSSLASVTIGNGVTTIGKSAFEGCGNLTKLVIGTNVTSIAYNAFSYCSNLTEIYYNATECSDVESGFNGNSITVIIGANVKRIPAFLFKGGSNYTNNLKVIFEEGSVCTTIGKYAFYFCNLSEIIIPKTITSIGESAFASTKLTTVYYEGSADEWKQIAIGYTNDKLTNATRYYYSETTPALNADGTAYDGNYWHYDTDGVTPIVWVYTKDE